MKLKLKGRYILITTFLLVIMISMDSCVKNYFFSQHSKELQSSLSKQSAENLLVQLEKRADSLTDYLAEALFNPLYRFATEQAYELLLPALAQPEIDAIYVLDSNGNVFHDGTPILLEFDQPFMNRAAVESLLEQGQSYLRQTEDHLVIGKPIASGDERIGAVIVRYSLETIKKDIVMASSLITELNDKRRKDLLILTGISTAILLVIGMILSGLAAHSLTKPLRQLMRHAQRIGEGEFDSLHSVKRQDEIGELVRSFNLMGEKLRRRTEEISFLAYHDPLTQLPNRARFIEHVDNLIGHHKEQPFVVLFIDLDEFKDVNDNFGHEVGDQLLCEISNRLVTNLRDEDYLAKQQVVARLGGDEFLICLQGIADIEHVDAVIERLFTTIKRPIPYGNEHLIVSCSMGVAHYPEAGCSAEELIKYADIAMYYSKAKGKNTHSYFVQDMNAKVEKRARIERELRKAMTNLRQFELWLQPQFDLESNRLVGAEALARWQHPEQGLIMPNEFISIAESTGMIVKIGDWLIESLCRQLHSWNHLLPDGFHVSLNLSARQIHRQDLVATFSRLLEQYTVSVANVRVEVTESLLMSDELIAEQTLNKLRGTGIQIWLDDFGTGYSSLSYLQRYRFDGLKIDRSFIADIEFDSQARALTQAIISMAHDLGMKITAEGVENTRQAMLLCGQQCDIGQGCLYAKPLPAREFANRYFTP